MKANRGKQRAKASPGDDVAQILLASHPDGESEPTHRTDGCPNASVNRDWPQQARPIRDKSLKKKGNQGQRRHGSHKTSDQKST
jgi:hypothetical protein